ncbi:hypothetical protein [Streptomyces sp. NPDC001268]|uniref:hypothetical protein n=1 Tax=Streptomyces sp. NPDC001268 TaxID=3364553 RepID=UPI00368F5655
MALPVLPDLPDLPAEVTAAATARGLTPVALARSESRARAREVLPPGTEIDYGGVTNVLHALEERRPRIALQTTIFVTRRDHYFHDGGHALDGKRRSERLVRLSGAPYTTVRPGWPDAGEGWAHLRTEQGGTGEDGVSLQGDSGGEPHHLEDPAPASRTSAPRSTTSSPWTTSARSASAPWASAPAATASTPRQRVDLRIDGALLPRPADPVPVAPTGRTGTRS